MKTINFYIDSSDLSIRNVSEYNLSYKDTQAAIDAGVDYIKTTSLANLSFDLIDQGYDIILWNKDKGIKLYPRMDSVGGKDIKRETNILKLVLGGYFDEDLSNKCIRTKENNDEEWVDLGLPSGKLWKSSNEDGFYTFDEAVEKFKDLLPTKEDFIELYENTSHCWDDNLPGIFFISENGHEIFLPAAGLRVDTIVCHAGSAGDYWSSSYRNMNYAYYLYFKSSNLDPANLGDRCYCQSVRLCK